MCGIAGYIGRGFQERSLKAMMAAQRHRGPDDQGTYIDPAGNAGLAHNRLSIIDLSAAGHQPMASADGDLWIVFNGEIYNYIELRAQLPDYPYRSRTDTEVILAAYQRWGAACLERLIGMFAFMIWDNRAKRLFAARDRFGVKPLYYHSDSDGTLRLSSEIKALHAGGVIAQPNEKAWASYLCDGHTDHSNQTFWKDIYALEPGHTLEWQDHKIKISRWYDLPERTGTEFDHRCDREVTEEYRSYLVQSIRLRFRSDVPVGINLSGGLDSSLLLSLVDYTNPGGSGNVNAYTFATGDSNYDELPWVDQMLSRTGHPSRICFLDASIVPLLAESVMRSQDEPYGGLPTVAYARLFEFARQEKSIVLLDGQGMDEQWAGYDYYVKQATGHGSLQGTTERPVRPECLTPAFRKLAEPFKPPTPYPDVLRNLQYRDIRYTKIPRALRFNDRVSMRSSAELREPFLDHRLFELSLRQPTDRKVKGSTRKWLLRQLANEFMPSGVTEAPKRPLQTPQREWLRGPLRQWAVEKREEALAVFGDSWLKPDAVRASWKEFDAGVSDNSFYIWQWVSLGMASQIMTKAAYA